MKKNPDSNLEEIINARKKRTAIVELEPDQQKTFEIYKKSEAILDALNQTAIVTITDAEGIITSVNDKFCEISGYSREELIGKSHCIVNTGILNKDFFKKMWKTILSGRVWHGEIVNRSKSNEIYWVSSTIVPRKNSEGIIEEFIAIHIDITMQKHAEAVARDGQEKALAAASAKADFLAHMSHEIRTPLNGLIGMTDLLLETPLNEEQMQYAKTVANCGEALLEIVNDVLDYSKIEAGKLSLEKIEYDPKKLLMDRVDMMNARAKAKGIELSISIAPDVPNSVLGDPTRIGQILLNLIGNSMKFTETGYVHCELGLINDDTNDEQITLQFQVKDSGIGMTEQQLDGLFQSFSQADSSTTRRFGGTGLGLSICKKLVSAMGGKIGVESKYGEGSRFWFQIAQTKSSLISTAKKDLSSLVDLPILESKTILVAEDNFVNQQLIKKYLEMLGHQVVIVANGIQAIKELEKNDFDLILMDCQMPEMDGYVATQEIRKCEQGTRHTLIVALTANATTEDRQHCIEAGMDDVLLKPIRRDLLAKTLAKWLS